MSSACGIDFLGVRPQPQYRIGDRSGRRTTARPDHARPRAPQRYERNRPSCRVAAPRPSTAGTGRAQPGDPRGAHRARGATPTEQGLITKDAVDIPVGPAPNRGLPTFVKSVATHRPTARVQRPLQRSAECRRRLRRRCRRRRGDGPPHPGRTPSRGRTPFGARSSRTSSASPRTAEQRRQSQHGRPTHHPPHAVALAYRRPSVGDARDVGSPNHCRPRPRLPHCVVRADRSPVIHGFPGRPEPGPSDDERYAASAARRSGRSTYGARRVGSRVPGCLPRECPFTAWSCRWPLSVCVLRTGIGGWVCTQA